MKRTGLFLLACTLAFTVMAQRADYNIIPLPREVTTDTTQLQRIASGMGIAYDSSNAEVSRTAQFLQQWVKETTGIQLQLTPDDKKSQVKLLLKPRFKPP